MNSGIVTFCVTPQCHLQPSDAAAAPEFLHSGHLCARKGVIGYPGVENTALRMPHTWQAG